MTVERDQTVRFRVPYSRVLAATREVLAEGHRSYSYRGTTATEDGKRLTTTVRPWLWPLILSTRMSIQLDTEDTSTRVAVRMRSQSFIMGDIFDIYGGYIRNFLTAVERILAAPAEQSTAAEDRASGQAGASSDGKHCPACGTDVGFWRVFFALPDRIWCPGCGSRLAYRQIGLLVLLVAAFVTSLIAIGVPLVLTWYEEFTYLLLYLACVFVACVPLGLAVTWYMREYKILERRSGKVPKGTA